MGKATCRPGQHVKGCPQAFAEKVLSLRLLKSRNPGLNTPDELLGLASELAELDALVRGLRDGCGGWVSGPDEDYLERRILEVAALLYPMTVPSKLEPDYKEATMQVASTASEAGNLKAVMTISPEGKITVHGLTQVGDNVLTEAWTRHFWAAVGQWNPMILKMRRLEEKIETLQARLELSQRRLLEELPGPPEPPVPESSGDRFRGLLL